MRYMLLKVGDIVKDGDEEYSEVDNGETVDPVRWRPVAAEYIGEVYDELVPVRRRVRVSGEKGP